MRDEKTICFHEAAHAITETLLIDDIESVSIEEVRDADGKFVRDGTMQGYPLKPETPVVNVLAQLYASRVAECTLLGIPAEEARSHAVNDIAQAEWYIEKYSDSDEEAQAMRFDGMSLAMRVVHDAEAEIRLLAAQLEYHRTVPGVSVREIIAQSPRKFSFNSKQ